MHYIHWTKPKQHVLMLLGKRTIIDYWGMSPTNTSQLMEWLKAAVCWFIDLINGNNHWSMMLKSWSKTGQ